MDSQKRGGQRTNTKIGRGGVCENVNTTIDNITNAGSCLKHISHSLSSRSLTDGGKDNIARVLVGRADGQLQVDTLVKGKARARQHLVATNKDAAQQQRV
eukprot:m.126010 g.126010  ORF g.126010 m.126010 type:complete len:100 (+) comp16328_c0_seq2:137-436(+)